MAYAGYLIKIIGSGSSDYISPLNYIQEKSYKCTLSTLDQEGYRDANGVLHRTAVLQVPHCSFNTMPLNNTQIGSLWQNIRSRYTQALEKRVTASVYVTELDSYSTASFYVPDVEMTIKRIKDGKIFYEPMTFEFIGYGE